MKITVEETIDIEDIPEGGVFADEARFPETDGVPLESAWHRSAINLLIDVILWLYRDRTDFYVGGNMFIYFSDQQADLKGYRGPDFFFVKDVDGTRPRRSWKLDREGGRYPDLLIELLSPKTAKEDRTTKKDLYERTFRTPEYFWFDPDTRELAGWRLQNGHYQAIVPNEKGWLWSEQLKLWVGVWQGTFQNQQAAWPRFYDLHGRLSPTQDEAEAERVNQEQRRAESERQRAESERQRAEAAEAEVARLKALLAQKDGTSPSASAE